MKHRVDFSEAVQTEVFTKCRRRCAFCYALNNDWRAKTGQIAHKPMFFVGHNHSVKRRKHEEKDSDVAHRVSSLEHYNNVRLTRAIGYITPKDMLAEHEEAIQAERDRKLEAARQQRKNRRPRAA